MSDAIYFAPLKVPVSDPRTGLMSREWYLFFQAMFKRSGGTIAPTPDDSLQGVPDAIGTADLLALVAKADDAAAQTPPSIAPLPAFQDMSAELQTVRDQLAEVLKRLDDAQQGTQL